MTVTLEKDKDSNVNVVLENGTMTSASDAGDVQVLVTDDTEVSETVKLLFMSVEPMDSLKDISAGSDTVVVDQRVINY